MLKVVFNPFYSHVPIIRYNTLRLSVGQFCFKESEPKWLPCLFFCPSVGSIHDSLVNIPQKIYNDAALCGNLRCLNEEEAIL